jgi:hypothetical protein
LLYCGLPTIQFGISEQEYNRRLSAAVKDGNHKGIYDAVLIALDYKFELLLGLFN